MEWPRRGFPHKAPPRRCSRQNNRKESTPFLFLRPPFHLLLFPRSTLQSKKFGLKPLYHIDIFLENASFYSAISSIQKAIEARESGLTRFSKGLTAEIIKILGAYPEIISECGFSNTQDCTDKDFDDAIRMLSELAPNMTVLSRKDAAKHHLLTAVDYLQKVMEEIAGNT